MTLEDSSPSRDASAVQCALEDAARGDPDAARRLLPMVYDELHRLAEQKMSREPAGHTLQPTALVHEAYLRLLGEGEMKWENRRHFFGAAAEAMRRILIERARRNNRMKHGGGRKRVDLAAAEPAAAAAGPDRDDVIAIDEALRQLEARDPVRASVVKLRYFAGLTIEQTASLLDLAPSTVSGHWTYARAWLYREIAGDSAERGSAGDPVGKK